MSKLLRWSLTSITLLTVLVGFTTAPPAQAAPWRAVGPEGAPFSSIGIESGSNTNLVATVRDRGLLRSVDGGVSWQEVVGSPSPALRIAVHPSNAALAVSTASQVWFRLAGDTRWLASKLSPADVIAIGPGEPVTVYGARGTSIQRAIGEGAAVSIAPGLAGARVRTLRLDPVRPTRLYAGTNDGLFLSQDRGTNWSRVGNALTGVDIVAVAADPRQASRLFAGGSDSGVWRSSDSGTTWVRVNEGLADLRIRDLAVDGSVAGRLWAGTEDGIFISNDHGTNWSRADLEPRAPVLGVVAGAAGGWAYVATSTGLVVTDDAGASWQPANGGLQATTVTALQFLGDDPREAVAGTTGGVFVTFDAGGQWSGLNEGLRSPLVQDLAVVGTDLFAATLSGAWRLPGLGQSWSRSNGITNPAVTAVVEDGAVADRLYAATAGGGVFRSSDAGATWRAANSGLSNLFLSRLAAVPGVAGEIYALAANQVFVSRNGGDSWTMAGPLPAGTIADLVVSPHTASLLFLATSTGVRRSRDGGQTWQETGLTGLSVESLLASARTPGSVYAGLRGGSIRVSFDDGITWQRLGGAGPLGSVLTMAEAADGRQFFAGTRDAGAWVAQQLCGDGELDPGESCDDGGNGGCPAGCGATSRCVGDCNGSGDVTVDEIVRGVSIGLGIADVGGCTAMDRNGDRQVTVDEIIAAVANALGGCSAAAASG